VRFQQPLDASLHSGIVSAGRIDEGSPFVGRRLVERFGKD
jgi:hypothetical protein